MGGCSLELLLPLPADSGKGDREGRQNLLGVGRRGCPLGWGFLTPPALRAGKIPRIPSLRSGKSSESLLSPSFPAEIPWVCSLGWLRTVPSPWEPKPTVPGCSGLPCRKAERTAGASGDGERSPLPARQSTLWSGLSPVPRQGDIPKGHPSHHWAPSEAQPHATPAGHSTVPWRLASPQDFLHSLANRPHIPEKLVVGKALVTHSPVADSATCPPCCGQSPMTGLLCQPPALSNSPPEQLGEQGFNPIYSIAPPPRGRCARGSMNSGRAGHCARSRQH